MKKRAFFGFFIHMCITMHSSENVNLTAYSQIVSSLRISGALPILPLCTLFIYCSWVSIRWQWSLYLPPYIEDSENTISLYVGFML